MNLIKHVTISICTAITLNACTPKMTFVTSSVVPAARGAVNVKKDKNNNYTLGVTIKNLAEPKNLTPAKNTYLVWMKLDDNSVKKLGQLSPSGKALTASLKATAVSRPQQVFITAEDNVDILYPAGQTILTTESN